MKKYIPFILTGLFLGRILGWIMTISVTKYIESQAVFKIVLVIGEIILPLMGAGVGVWSLKRIEHWTRLNNDKAKLRRFKALLVSFVIILSLGFVWGAWFISDKLDGLESLLFLPIIFLAPVLLLGIIGVVASIMPTSEKSESSADIMKNDQIDAKLANDKKWARRFLIGIFGPIVISAGIVFTELISGIIAEDISSIILVLMLISAVSVVGIIMVGIKMLIRKFKKQL